ncbi:hypothetical protein D1AOALGA4SA_4610 [Olavius algarvensis Delta 1 endosymbiont]|nr:hypothetical protein D1AOALGA4SA_4610 [Olavius algarvensis Delta 1 endosymbiont]
MVADSEFKIVGKCVLGIPGIPVKQSFQGPATAYVVIQVKLPPQFSNPLIATKIIILRIVAVFLRCPGIIIVGAALKLSRQTALAAVFRLNGYLYRFER